MIFVFSVYLIFFPKFPERLSYLIPAQNGHIFTWQVTHLSERSEHLNQCERSEHSMFSERSELFRLASEASIEFRYQEM